MINFVICDDDVNFSNELKKELIILLNDLNIEYNLTTLFDGDELISYIKNKNNVNIILLDIKMKRIGGIKVGEFIKNNFSPYDIQVIFVSSNEAFAMKLFKLRPHDFIVKPIDKIILKESVTDAIKNINTKDYFLYKNSEYMCKIKLKDITHFSINGRYIDINTLNGNNDSFVGRIKDVYSELNKFGFIFTHRSFLVNFKNASKITKDTIYFLNGNSAPISRNYFSNVKKFLIKDAFSCE